MIFLSKYFSRANEKINNENIAISNDGINVNKPKEIIYFLFATDPLTFILFLIEFFISTKINTKNNNKKIGIQSIMVEHGKVKSNCFIIDKKLAYISDVSKIYNKDHKYFTAKFFRFQRALPNFKNLQYKKIISLQKKINLQKEEILFYFNNKILEGSTTNLIFVNSNKLFIPKNYYYYGITLEYLIKNLPYKIHRTDINISSLHQFSEILLVGSGKGVVSISFIKQFNWYRSSMKMYNLLSKKYSKILLK